MQNTQPTPMNKRIMMPVAGAPLFISDRTRDAQIRNETMKQANLHSKAIHELHTQIMLEAEENMLKSETIDPQASLLN